MISGYILDCEIISSGGSSFRQSHALMMSRGYKSNHGVWAMLALKETKSGILSRVTVDCNIDFFFFLCLKSLFSTIDFYFSYN
jgi:hypothetical protein